MRSLLRSNNSSLWNRRRNPRQYQSSSHLHTPLLHYNKLTELATVLGSIVAFDILLPLDLHLGLRIPFACRTSRTCTHSLRLVHTSLHHPEFYRSTDESLTRGLEVPNRT